MRLQTDLISYLNRISVAITAGLAFVFAGCSKSGNNPVSSSQVSTVQGEVYAEPGVSMAAGRYGLKFQTGNSSTGVGVAGATVTLAQIQVDGSLKTVSTAPATTDMNGRFSVNTNLSNVNDLVVVASQGSNEWESVVSGAVRHGSTVYCQPMTNQTTVQAQAYSKIVADGKGNEVTPAELEMFVNESVAANVAGNANEIAELAAALEAESEAQSTAFSQFDVTQAQLQAAATARQQAQVSLEAALNSAADDSAADDVALQTYYAALVGAYVAAGIPMQMVAEGSEIACAALTNFSASMSAGAAFSVEQSAALVRAALVGQAVLSQLQAGGASQAEVASADSANTDLIGALEFAQTARVISNAFANYHASIMAQMESMTGSDSSAVASEDSQVESTGGAYGTLQASLATASTTGAIVQAYMTFYGSVTTMMQGMGGMGPGQLNASIQILMLVDADD